MNEADKYRDASRYRSGSTSKSSLNLGINEHSKSGVEFAPTESPISESSVGNANLEYQANLYTRRSSSEQKYSHQHIKKSNRLRKRKSFLKGFIAVVLLIAAGIGAWRFWPIKVHINGQEQVLIFDKSLNKAIEDSGIEVKPGNFIAVDYSIITPSLGNEYYVEVNDTEVNNLAIRLHDGDDIKYENGKDRMEEYTSDDSNIVAKSQILGVGAVHKFKGSGQPGTWSILKGNTTGKYAERQTKDPDDVTVSQYNINPGKDKVVALTFDDGPSDEYTQDILDLLKKYDAKATFFVIGERLEENWAKKLVKKEDEEGHQVCSHTYDHARSAGGTDITVMTAEKQIEEVTKGLSAISLTLGKQASSVVRLPGGSSNPVTCRLIAPYVSAEIGWNVDTGDWHTPGTEKVLSNLKLAASGDIILCHDGGGNREQTVKALEDFLKTYSEKGYRFITIDELMEYDAAEQKTLP